LTYTDKMTFTQRLSNTIHSHIETILYNFIHLPKQRKLYNQYFPNAKKSFDEMYKSSAVIFLNNHVASSSPRPYLPNMIEIGGIHVEPAKPLPKDIQEFLDSATDGAILFSMGSMIQSKMWPDEKREAFVKTFGKLKQKVLWKYENETLPNKPDNVMISPWIPQRDILAHPNVKLFITHGGLLGTTEATVEGVPILGIPIYGDQKMNMAKANAREYGLKVAFEEVSEEKLTEALTELLSNPKYSKNAKRISSYFVDRPMKMQDLVVYWVDYAVRHNGAHHLRAHGNNLNFIEFHLIDVYLVIGLIGSIVLLINFLILKMIVKKIFRKKVSKDKKRK
jgi:glucuronosyltransferase